MTVRKYRVSMLVPLGERTGQMLLHEVNGKVSGTLDILGHIEPFTGSLAADGRCELCGKIISAMRTIPYKASGSITKGAIKLTLYGEPSDLFYMTGEEKTISAYGEVL